VPVLSDVIPGESWNGRRGLVHQAVMQDLPDLSGHEVYACGAPAMIEAARRDFCARCGLPESAFYADAFTPAVPASH
jgi:CDP-4-dehydro-6-deoxyglucose reductase, E3